jgi:hypothetical protein
MDLLKYKMKTAANSPKRQHKPNRMLPLQPLKREVVVVDFLALRRKKRS